MSKRQRYRIVKAAQSSENARSITIPFSCVHVCVSGECIPAIQGGRSGWLHPCCEERGMMDARERVEESLRRRIVARKTVSQEKRNAVGDRRAKNRKPGPPVTDFLYGERRPTFPCMADREGGETSCPEGAKIVVLHRIKRLSRYVYTYFSLNTCFFKATLLQSWLLVKET